MRGEEFIPIIFFMVVGAILWKFFDGRHKERMAMIDKGVVLDSPTKRTSQSSIMRSLKWGLLGLSTGLGLLGGIWIINANDIGDREGGPFIVIALMILSGGLSLLIFYFIAANKIPQEEPANGFGTDIASAHNSMGTKEESQ